MFMPRGEADFWVQVAHSVHGVMLDEMVYSQDLRLYAHRSIFLEQLEPFIRVVSTATERTDVPVDREAFIIGGLHGRGRAGVPATK